MDNRNQSFWGNIIAGLQARFSRGGQPLTGTAQKPEGAEAAYASFYPTYEIASPQYVTPGARSLAEVGYRENELAYACINERAVSVGEPSLMVYDDTGETPEEIKKHPLAQLMRRPCKGVNQREFWQIVETYCLIAGFSAWEKERNNRGEVIALWPMRPDWCSFYRGEGQPIRAIKYQPEGLPPLDIPINDVVLFQYFDPLYPLLKGFSPTAVALQMLNTDNAMTLMIDTFIKNGAFLGGMLKTEQALTQAEADRAAQLWQQKHGGSDKAGSVPVLGKGLEYKPTQNTFREMVFPEVDARSEARICMAYRVSPLLIAAKVGIGIATYNNYAEARKAFYERVIVPGWEWLAWNLWEQLLPDFEETPDNFACHFDMRKIGALQEDKTAAWARAQSAAGQNLITRDEAREVMGYDPIDNADIFVGGQVETLEDQTAEPEPVPAALAQANQGEEQPPALLPADQDDQDEQAEQDEAEKFRVFAKKRIKENKISDIPQFEFKHTAPEKAVALVAMYAAPALFEQMDKAIKALEFKGGDGSGHFGHLGRPGKVGGSAPSGASNTDIGIIGKNLIGIGENDLQKIIDSSDRQKFIRYSSNIEGDFERGWSAWMSARSKNAETSVTMAFEQTNYEDIADAIDVRVKDLLDYDSEYDPTTALDNLFQESSFDNRDEFFKDLNEKLIDAGILGYDPFTGETAMIDRRGGGGISSYTINSANEVFNYLDSVPTGDGAQARGNYRIIGTLSNPVGHGRWYLFEADNYGLER